MSKSLENAIDNLRTKIGTSKKKVNETIAKRKLKLKEAVKNMKLFRSKLIPRIITEPIRFYSAYTAASQAEYFQFDVFLSVFMNRFYNEGKISLKTVKCNDVTAVFEKHGVEMIRRIEGDTTHNEDSIFTLVYGSNTDYSINYFSKIYTNSSEWKIFYNSDKATEFDSIIKELENYKDEEEKISEEKSKFNILIDSNGYLNKYPIELEESKYEFEELYNDNIVEEFNDMISILEDKETGSFLLRGCSGGGKTNALYEAARRLEREVIFIASADIGMLSSPSFIPFLLRNKNVVLFLEDSGSAIKDRKKYPQYAPLVEGLLQLSDGFLAKSIKCAIVLSVNEEITDLDPAIVRSGRMHKIIEFEPLNVEKSNKLLEKLGSEDKVEEPTILANLFNKKAKTTKERKKIGFGTR